MNREIEITPLGGFGEFGKNGLVLRAGGAAIVVDAGISFPDDALPGIDRVAPDFSPLSADRVAGIFLTHGHEDHIGALSRLLDVAAAPVHATGFTRALARRRLLEAGAASGSRSVSAAEFGRPVAAGPFSVTFLPVSHSVPQSAALLIEAFGRRVFHSGDFKIDDDAPEGERTNLADLAARAGGCDLAVLDATNAERGGGCPSEREAREGLRVAASGAGGRVLVTTFSSHVARMSAAVEAARATGRSVAILGKSMREIGEIGESLGYLSIPAGLAADPDRLASRPASRLLVLCAGSQGEPQSALSRLSAGRHDQLSLESGDLAIFSARTIPGRERAVSRVVDGLLRTGVRILPNDPSHPDGSGDPGGSGRPRVHVSGHAYGGDLRRLIEAIRPRAVLPAHGERRALLACGRVAGDAGVPEGNVFLCDNGDSVFLGEDGFRFAAGARPAGAVFLDAAEGAEVSPAELRDRRALGAQGVLAVTVLLRPSAIRVEVAGRGLAEPAGDVAARVEAEVLSSLARARPEELARRDWVRSETELAAKRACRREFGLRPVIVVLAPEG